MHRVSKAAIAVFMTGALVGCHHVAPIGQALFGHTTRVLPSQFGAVAADEPRAAMVGRDILAAGGNAADAATAMGLALAVTLPSRASLGGGGACLVTGHGQTPRAVMFLAQSGGATAAQRPASVPMLLRGLYRLQRDHGHIAFEDLMTPAIRLAAEGTSVSPRLASDIAAVQTALFADDAARSLFARVSDTPVVVGDRIIQPRLARFLARIQRKGVGDLYIGALGQFFADEANLAGGGVTRAALRKGVTTVVLPLRVMQGDDVAWFLPPPADGGLGAAAAFEKGVSAQAAVAAWRAQHGVSNDAATAQAWLTRTRDTVGALPALPASTSFVVMDRSGGAVACSLTDNNLFGTGRLAAETGVVLGASPDVVPLPLLSAAVTTRNGDARAAFASSGQNDASDALAAAVKANLQGMAAPKPTADGRVNVVHCEGAACIAQADPRERGLALDDQGPAKAP